MEAMDDPVAILGDPLAEAQDVEHALQALLSQKASGRALSAAAVASVRSVAEEVGFGTWRSELCADILDGVDVTSDRRSQKRPRRLVDAATHGPQVPRWNSAADAAAERQALSWNSAEAAAAATVAAAAQGAAQPAQPDQPAEAQGAARPERSDGAGRAPRRPLGKAFSVRSVLTRGGRGKHVAKQIQAVLVHAHRVLQKLSSSRRQQLLQMLPLVPLKAGAARHISVAGQILGRLLGMSPRTIDNHVNFVNRSGCFCKRPRVFPAPAEKGSSATATVAVADGAAGTASCGATMAQAAPQEGFVNLVRVTQFMSSHGLSKSLLPNLVYLISAARGDVGSSRHNKRFQSVAEAAADSLLTRQAIAWLTQPLGGSGRLPDLEVFCDGGCIGQYFSRARDQVMAAALASTSLLSPCRRGSFGHGGWR